MHSSSRKSHSSSRKSSLFALFVVIALVHVFSLAMQSERCLAASDPEPERPNVILILADDLSADVLPLYGGQSVQTPNLNQLAESGILFSHCYSTQLCMPSRCELMTGKYSHRNFVGRGNLAVGEATIASELKKAGYATCQIEKWHLNIRGGAMPPQVGFDEYYHTKLAHNYFDPVIDVNGNEREFPGEYGPHVCQDFAFDFINRNRERPFFLFYAMHLPHAPFHVPPGCDLGDSASASEKYFAMVEHQDDLVGQLVKKLESLNLRQNTLLIFTGDNGTPHGIHYRVKVAEEIQVKEGRKGSLSDGGTHVPLIVNWPSIAAKDRKAVVGSTSDTLVDFADFLPTLMNAAGLSPKPGLKIDGQSFFSQLTGNNEVPLRRHAFKFGCQNGGKGAFPTQGYWARTQRWKLYDNGQLYDMEQDDREQSAIALSELDDKAAVTVSSLQETLKQSGAEAVVKQFKGRRKK